jgi:hypothetical protein
MDAFERFCHQHCFAVPSFIAADYLSMTPQGLYQAAERGWIAYFQHGRNRWYSYRDVIRYRWQSRKFKDNHPSPPYAPGEAGHLWQAKVANLDPTDPFGHNPLVSQHPRDIRATLPEGYFEGDGLKF